MTTTAKRRDMLAGWPKKGYSGPQPWDHDALGISRSARDEIGSGRNTVTPVISHDCPILTSGSSHPMVHELGRKLGDLGFENSVSRGENPFGAVDQSVLDAVRHFRRQYGVAPDASGFDGDARKADAHLDPWTVEAILRAHRQGVEES